MVGGKRGLWSSESLWMTGMAHWGWGLGKSVPTKELQRTKEWIPRAGPAHSAQPTSRTPFHSPLPILKTSKLTKSTQKHSQNQHPFGAVQWSDITLHQGVSEHKFLEFWGSFWRSSKAGPFISPSSFSLCHGEEPETALGSDPTWWFPSSLLVWYRPGLSDHKSVNSQLEDEKKLWKMRKWRRDSCFKFSISQERIRLLWWGCEGSAGSGVAAGGFCAHWDLWAG